MVRGPSVPRSNGGGAHWGPYRSTVASAVTTIVVPCPSVTGRCTGCQQHGTAKGSVSLGWRADPRQPAWSALGPLLVGAAVAGPHIDQRTVGGAGPDRVEAESCLDAGDG